MLQRRGQQRLWWVWVESSHFLCLWARESEQAGCRKDRLPLRSNLVANAAFAETMAFRLCLCGKSTLPADTLPVCSSPETQLWAEGVSEFKEESLLPQAMQASQCTCITVHYDVGHLRRLQHQLWIEIIETRWCNMADFMGEDLHSSAVIKGSV